MQNVKPPGERHSPLTTKSTGFNPAKIIPEPERGPFNSDVADVLEDFKPPVVSFHFGLPSPDLLARVKYLGSRILSSATTL